MFTSGIRYNKRNGIIMETLIDMEQKRLIKKFHTLLGKANIDSDGKEAILSAYNVESTKDLTVGELIEVCNAIDTRANPRLAELDKYRKRLMASIGGWLRAMTVSSNGAKIKAIACRASGKSDFNDIPLEQLRSLYAAFNKKQKDLAMVENITIEELNKLTLMN